MYQIKLEQFMARGRGEGSLFKRGSTWWIFYIDPYTKERRRESSGSRYKADAEALLKDRLARPADKNVTVDELLNTLLQDYKERGKRNVEKTISRLKPIRDAIGHLRAVDVSEETIIRYQRHRTNHVSNATINRECQLIGQGFKLGVQKRLVPRPLMIRKLPEGNIRQGFFEPLEVEELVAYLPDYLKDVVRFAYYTGWRKSEITTLTWDDVHLRAGLIILHPSHSKNGQAKTLTLTQELTALVQRRLQECSDHSKLVFHRHGEFIRDFRKAWYRATEQAGLKGRLFHDLRRSSVRDMIRAGVHERIAMEVSGHKTRSIFDRYNITNERDIHDALERTAHYRKLQLGAQ
jgi:integrase